jgi:pimeloyl-ACP methyl ester carboxylesterase
MATFLLVHGAWAGGWCYKRVAKLLRSQGHEVYTPTNTGLGERAHLYHPAISLDTHVEDIMNVVRWEDLDDFVLAGHSYGGMIVTGVADKIPEKIRTLVYIDAFVPENGKCQFDYLPQRVEGMRKDAEANNNGISPIPPEVFMVNQDDVPLFKSKCVRHPIHTFDQPVKLSGGLSRLRNKRVFVSAAAYGGTFKQFYDVLKDDRNWRTYKVENCGHMIMLDKPVELAKILLDSI